MPAIASPPSADAGGLETRLRRAAAATAVAIALLYGLIYAGVLSVGRAEQGELGILGVAALVFVVLAGALLWSRSRVLWAGVGVLQLLLFWMYLAIAPERDPSFEVWGITIRVLSLVLVAVVVLLLLATRRGASDAG